MVFGLGHHHREEEAAYNNFYEGGGGGDFEGNKLHEGLAGAAAFYAMKKYEERRAAEGHDDHAFAREMLAAVTAAEVDKFAEEKGMSWEEKERAKAAARDRANSMYNTYYVEGYAPEPPGGTAAARAYAPNAGGYTSAGDYVAQGYEGFRGPEGGFASEGRAGGQPYYAGGAGYGGVNQGFGGQGVDPSLMDPSGDMIAPAPGFRDDRYGSYPGQRERYGRGGMGDF